MLPPQFFTWNGTLFNSPPLSLSFSSSEHRKLLFENVADRKKKKEVAERITLGKMLEARKPALGERAGQR